MEVIGQPRLQAIIATVKEACEKGNGYFTPPHLLLTGGPGLGKTFFSSRYAGAAGRALESISCESADPVSLGAAFYKSSHWAGSDRTCAVFLDEVHFLPAEARPNMLSAMVGEKAVVSYSDGSNALEYRVPDCLVVAATTDPGKLSHASRTRFGLQYAMEPYSTEEIQRICEEYFSKEYGFEISSSASKMLSSRSNGVPRECKNLFHYAVARCRSRSGAEVSFEDSVTACDHLGIDESGMDAVDRAIVSTVESSGSRGATIRTLKTSAGTDESDIGWRISKLSLRGILETTSTGVKLK